jgi:predicted nucleic acid-binding protein
LDANLLLIDEDDGRKVALRRGLGVTGLLGVLAVASREGLLDFESMIEQLRSTNFRMSERLIEQARVIARPR